MVEATLVPAVICVIILAAASIHPMRPREAELRALLIERAHHVSATNLFRWFVPDDVQPGDLPSDLLLRIPTQRVVNFADLVAH